MDYTTMPLLRQLAVIQADVGAVGTLRQMADMWGRAAAALEKSNSDFAGATSQLEPNWTDDSGVDFVTNARESGKTIDGWAKNIRDSQAQAKIEQVAGELPPTAKAVRQVVDQYRALLPFAAQLGMTPEQLELMFRPLAGAAMNKLAGTYQQATDAVSKARGGNWQGLAGDHPGGGAVSEEDGRAIDVPMAQQGMFGAGAQGAGPSAASRVDVLAGNPVVDVDNPGLSGGLGGAPVAPTAPPPVAPTPPPLPVGGMPLGTGMSGFGGRGVAGGARVPGVRLGGPTGAQPVNTPAAPAPASAPTVAQLTSATPASSAGTGGVPPMVPPMAGGMGMRGVAGGGAPGPGLARRTHRDDDDPPTPGLPAMLSGKAGLPDAFRYTSANRAEDSDAPGTVQLIDEDLWHDEAPPAGRRSYV